MINSQHSFQEETEDAKKLKGEENGEEELEEEEDLGDEEEDLADAEEELDEEAEGETPITLIKKMSFFWIYHSYTWFLWIYYSLSCYAIGQ